MNTRKSKAYKPIYGFTNLEIKKKGNSVWLRIIERYIK